MYLDYNTNYEKRVKTKKANISYICLFKATFNKTFQIRSNEYSLVNYY